MRPSPTPAPFLVSTLAMLFGCSASIAPAPTSSTTLARNSVERRLETRLSSDPNRELCDRLAATLATGDSNTIRPLFDFASFVERIVTRSSLPPEIVARLRANPSGPANFARYLAPPGSRYRCLGTRSLLGEPYIAIRQWTPTRWDYLLLRLTGNAEHPFDDYHIVSSGLLHSEIQAAAFDPQLEGPMQVVGRMLQQSYDRDFAGIISAYRTLPSTLQNSPIGFSHLVNAVFSIEATDSPMYRETTARMADIWSRRDYALAYWQRIDAHRRGDEPAETRARDRLIELLDDYELLER